jgi:peroxiredoxin
MSRGGHEATLAHAREQRQPGTPLALVTPGGACEARAVTHHRRSLSPVVLAVLAFALVAAGCGKGSRALEDRHASPPAAGDAPGGGSAADHPRAPEVVLADLDGGTLRLSDHRGKVVLLGFWATWCGPCRREIPRLQALQKAYASRGLVIVGLSVDREDGPEEVHEFVRANGMTWPNAIADDAVVQSFGSVEAIPTTFVIDREGRIAHRLVGLQSEERLRQLLEPLLESGSS